MKNKITNHVLNISQKLINRKYQKDGPTEQVIKAQTKINEFRNKHNIVDKEEIIYKGFVQ